MLSLKNNIQKYLIWLVLLIAAALRLYNFNLLPLQNDELSALYRLRFDGIFELIQYGVIPDGHPAGVQIFLYYYTIIFGTNEMVIKAPFVCCSLLSIYVAYLFFTNIFNDRVALAVAAFMATSQIFISHSITIRPYSFGIFFTLLVAYILSEIVGKQKHKNINYLVLTLSMVACALTHYFSALTSIILFFCFFFIEQNKYKPKLIYTSLVSVVIYSFHFFITWHQMQSGGLIWLAAPDANFATLFYKYINHYNLFCMLYMLICIGLTQYFFIKHKKQKKMLLVCIITFFLSYFIAYFYSIYVSPVMQFSVLVFALPFLLSIVFYGFIFINKKLYYLLVATLVLGNVYSLVNTRQHYTTNYNFIYNEFIKSIPEYTKNDTLHTKYVLNGIGKNYFNYYIKKYHIPVSFLSVCADTFSYKNFKKMIANCNANQIYFASTSYIDNTYLCLIKEKFSTTMLQKRGSLHEIYLLSKTNANAYIPKYSKISDTTQRGTIVQMYLSNNSLIDYNVSVNIKPTYSNEINPILKLQIEDSVGHIMYNIYKDYNAFYLPSDSVTQIHIAGTYNNIKNTKGLLIKAYIINESKNNFEASVPKINIENANTLLFGIVSDISK